MARRSVVRAPRRSRFWIRTAIVVPKSASSTSTDLFASYRSFASLGNMNALGTIAAIRLQFLYNLNTATNISFVHLGLILGSTVAGGPQPNDPSSSAAANAAPGADWLMNHRFYTNGVGSAVSSPTISREVVLRGMRKITDPQQTLFVVNSADSDAGTLNLAAHVLFIRN